MTKLTKFAAVAAAALALSAGSLATSSEAHAWGKGGLGFGIAAGIVGAAAVAATAPTYYGGPGCRWVSRYDNWGNYRGSVKVCEYY